jgi:hypothetical protein
VLDQVPFRSIREKATAGTILPGLHLHCRGTVFEEGVRCPVQRRSARDG